jgi:hypothetical protein
MAFVNVRIVLAANLGLGPYLDDSGVSAEAERERRTQVLKMKMNSFIHIAN